MNKEEPVKTEKQEIPLEGEPKKEASDSETPTQENTTASDKPYSSRPPSQQRRGAGKKYDRLGGRGYRFRTDRIEQQNLVIDYKRPDVLKLFLTDQGKILPQRFTGNSAKNQRRLVRHVKIARVLGLLPFYSR